MAFKINININILTLYITSRRQSRAPKEGKPPEKAAGEAGDDMHDIMSQYINNPGTGREGPHCIF